MKNRIVIPFALLSLFILIIGLACGASSSGEQPTPIPPTTAPPTDVPPTEPPPPTEVPPTEPPLSSPTPLLPPTEEPPTEEPPTEEPAAEAPAYYKEEFDESASTYYPDEYFYEVLRGPDNASEDIYLDDRGHLVFEINTRDTYYYLYYNPWVYSDVRVGVEAENLGVNSQSISLVCRKEEGRGWIEFNIAGDGTYSIFAFDELQGTGYNQIYSGGSTAINIGKKTNTYIAECIGDEISLFANGVEVRTQTIPNAYQFIREGTVGFSVSSFNSVPVLVEMEWFWIEQP